MDYDGDRWNVCGVRDTGNLGCGISVGFGVLMGLVAAVLNWEGWGALARSEGGDRYV